MKYVWVALLLLCTKPVAAQQTTWVDHVMVTTSSALIIADWSLTMHALGLGYPETNPLLGRTPSKGHATTMIALGLVANIAVLKVKDPTIRKVIWAFVILGEADAVSSNLQAGFHFRI